MSEFENIISKKDIKNYGMKSRDSIHSIQGNCGKIADIFEGYLIDFCGLPYKEKEYTGKYGVMHIRVGPNGEEKHFIFYIDGEFIDGYFPGEEILIDLSFDQFNDTNKQSGKVSISYGTKEELDKIRILKPDDDRLSSYSRIGDKLFNHI